MSKSKKFDLLRVKEQVKRQKSINDLNQLNVDAEKCEKISTALRLLLNESFDQTSKIGVNSFVSNRQLMQRMMDQKEVISNRIEFLDHEKASLINELVKSKVKDQIILKKKIETEKKELEHRFKKNDENLNSMKRLR